MSDSNDSGSEGAAGRSAENPRRIVREEDYDDSSEGSRTPNSKRSHASPPPKNTRNNDEDPEDEDDEEDEDEDEEEEDTIHRPRKRRKPLNQFLDVEAEVDDEEEEDPDDEEDGLEPGGGFIAETHPDDIGFASPNRTSRDKEAHDKLDREREQVMREQAEMEAERLKKRYGRSKVSHSDSIVVPQRLLVPDVNDPDIWSIRCKPGKEREVLFALMKRIQERALSKAPVKIFSAFERGGTMAGHLYVEAGSLEEVKAAFEGISNVYPRSQTFLVPVKEREALLKIRKSKELELGAYVRIKRGKYAGDLAQVEEIEQNGLEVRVRLVPRLDYGLLEDTNGPDSENGMAKRKRVGGAVKGLGAVRPAPKLFSEVEARKKHSKYLSPIPPHDKKHWNYLGETYEFGFLVKDFRLQHLQIDDVNPTLEEVSKFVSTSGEDGTEHLDLSALAATIKDAGLSSIYLPGDTVEVYEGEQQGVWGKALTVQGDIVKIRVSEGELKGQELQVPQKGLRKRFREGDHVKVVGSSKYKDEVGMVVRISQDRVTLMSDMNMQEITVFSKDLREASDIGGAGSLGKFDLHDLVQLDPSTVGCIIKIDRETFRVLDQVGSIRTLMPSQISNKLERRRHAVATDRNGSEIRTEDTVKEVGGESKQGVIMHIYRSYLFCHNREISENSGVFVVRTTNVATVAAKGGRAVGSTGPDLTKMNPAVQRNGNSTVEMGPPKSFGRDRALGYTVTIRKGPHKGLLGIVKDTTDTMARIELHTKSKVITVAKETLAFKDPVTGQSRSYADTFSGGRRGGGGGRGGFSNGGGSSRVPNGMSGSRTPVAASPARTPAWSLGRTPAAAPVNGGDRTPGWRSSSSRTPAWAPDGSRTVNPYQDGSRTSYGQSGSRTPAQAWNVGSRTPYGAQDSSSGPDPWGPKTPAHHTSTTDGWGAQTPAHHSYGSSSAGHDTWASGGGPGINNGPTPRYDAPTPGASNFSHMPQHNMPDQHAHSGHGLSAPTPGAGAGAPTPGPYNAPTPAAAPINAPTPGAWGASGWADSAPTPGAYGGAPTPSAARGAPTPGGYAPETPGGWDAEDDGGPRYASRTPSP